MRGTNVYVKRGILGKKGKGRPTADSPQDTQTDNEGEDDKECLFDFSKERSTTRTGGQQIHLHKNPTEDKWRNSRKD